MLLYYAQIHSNQAEYKDNRSIAKTITINLLDFKYLKSDKYLSKITIPSKLEEKIELYVLDLPKFRINSYENLTKKQAWMLYLCNGQDLVLANIFKKYDKIKELDDLLEDFWRNEVME